MNQKHKTLRSFYCEDALWETFEVMTRDLDCSMDYLINEAMRHHAQSRNYGAPAASPSGGFAGVATTNRAPAMPGGVLPANRPPTRPRLAAPAPVQQDLRTIPISSYQARQNASAPPGFPGGARPTVPRMPPPPPRHAPPAPRAPMAPQAPQQPPQPQQPQQAHGHGQPYAQQGPAAGGWPQQQTQQPSYAAPQQPPLFLYFNGQRYVISKDRFVVGRGSQGTDLTIRDGNISRKHAAVIYHDGAYFIQDLGSTNGIEYRGAKVDSKQVEEGDLFNICDYELRFSYQG